MKLLFLGDIVGKPGRKAVTQHLPGLRQEFGIDFVVANAENAAHGFGLTESNAEELFEAGCDVLTGGNHTWDKTEIIPLLERDSRVLRPANFPAGAPGKGAGLYETAAGHRVLVINILCRVFMDLYDDPFAALDGLLPKDAPVRAGFDFVLVDMHGEASSEKYAIGHLCDGVASLVVGTHTHVPTGDAHILAAGTGYQTDAGMCGTYDSVIGMDKHSALDRFLGRIPKPRLEVAEGEGTLCGVLLETEPATGLARSIQPVRRGGMLQPV